LSQIEGRSRKASRHETISHETETETRDLKFWSRDRDHVVRPNLRGHRHIAIVGRPALLNERGSAGALIERKTDQAGLAGPKRWYSGPRLERTRITAVGTENQC